MPKQTLPQIEINRLRHGEVEAVCSQLTLPLRTEYVLTANGSDPVALDHWLHDQVLAAEAYPMGRFIFADGPYYKSLGNMFSKEEGSLLRLREDVRPGGCVFAMQVVALKGVPLAPLRQQGRNIGVIYEDDDARYCRLSGVIPLDLTASREAQTRAVLEMLDWILKTNDFSFTDTVRTWFYLDHLLDWYKEFNEVRTNFFTEHGVFEKLVPASTGIGLSNPWGAALTCDLLAVQPKTDKVCIAAVPSPLQESALKYASSFSRAVEIQMPTHVSLLISGTASIDSEGITQFEGDHARQIERTLQVVAALLESRGMTWGDVTRGIAYFVDMADRESFDAQCKHLKIPPFPLALAHADICRHDLLFELEVDAVKVPSGGTASVPSAGFGKGEE